MAQTRPFRRLSHVQGTDMLDIVFLAAGLAFLGLCLAYTTLCERL